MGNSHLSNRLKFESQTRNRQTMMLQRLIPLFSLVLCRDFERASGQDIERFEPLVPDAIDLLAECP